MKSKVSSRKFASVAIIAMASVLSGACSSTYHMTHSPSNAEFTSAQKSALSAKKSHVPCRLEVVCPDDMTAPVGWSSISHYPLKQIVKDVFSNALYSSFDQPGGEVLDAFTLRVEVFKSELDMSDGFYSLQLLATLEEPGEKKIVTLSVDKTVHSEEDERNVVPVMVYTASKELAIEVLNGLKANPKVVKTVSRFERK